MTVAAATICDVCTTQKQETNHWLVALVGNDDLLFMPASNQSRGYFDGLRREDICGADCAHTRLSQWLTQQGL